MTRAEERMNEMIPEVTPPKSRNIADNFAETLRYALMTAERAAFIMGYKQAEKDILAIIKDNIDRTAKCMEEATGFDEYPYWDGAHDMANAIRREIETEE